MTSSYTRNAIMAENQTEIQIQYPGEWEERWKKDSQSLVDEWCKQYPYDFSGITPNDTPSTLTIFAQYALMYLLRKTEGVSSLTWCYVAERAKKSINRTRTLTHWAIMSYWMGRDKFEQLQTALWQAGFTGFKGEPDLFCWYPNNGEWFFAEAKGKKDKYRENQDEWSKILKEVFGEKVDIRKYRLTPH
jgi:hypothetical protein